MDTHTAIATFTGRPDADAALPSHDGDFAAMRAEALRRLFPLHALGRAQRHASAVARRLHAWFRDATTADELERRIAGARGYPRELIDEAVLRDGRRVLVRPVLPRDAALQRAFVQAMSKTTRLFRFHGMVADLPEAVLRYLTEVDYIDHLALVGEVVEGGAARLVAEARWVRRADAPDSADFAIAIADDYQLGGLGNALLDRLQRSAAARGIRRLHGHVLRGNHRMRGWLLGRGWTVVDDPLDPAVVCVSGPCRTAAFSA